MILLTAFILWLGLARINNPIYIGIAICRYPDYTFYGDTKIAQSARLGSRYSKASLRGVLVDIFMLSKCDFLCCTFSSQVNKYLSKFLDKNTRCA